MADAKRINKKVLLQYKDWLVQNYAVNSVNSMLVALNQFLEFLNLRNLKVKRIKVQKQPFLQNQKELTEKECRKLIVTAIAEGWIFVTKNGKLKDKNNIWREMKRLKEKAEVAESKIFPHNFRHLFARIYYKVTKDITGLADLLGHSNINVKRIYTATTETVFQKKLDKIVEQEILECTT